MANIPPSGRDNNSARLKVFLSYSRKDGVFAQELLSGLELLNFDAYFDQEDIAPGEPWEERLGNLIRLADTVVFIISPNSLKSKHCSWEAEETARAGKRLVPVILTEVPNEDVPERLRKLNYVYFTEGHSFSKALRELASALRADAGWLRDHTRYGELAIRWTDRNKSAALLLRGSDLDEAKTWATERPTDAPEISANQLSYIEASSKAVSDELSAKAKLRWRVQAGLAFASIILAALSVFSVFQWQTAEATKTLLADSNARLERRLALRAAPRGYTPYDVPAGWFQVATSYASSVAFVEHRTEQNKILASGVLVRARLLNKNWDDKPVFVTASYVVAKDNLKYSHALPPSQARIIMLSPKNERRTANLGKILWQSEALGISISSIEDALPIDVTVVKVANRQPVALTSLAAFSPSDADALFDENAMLKQQGEPRPIVFVGNLQGRNEVAISISHLLGGLDTAVSDMPSGAPNMMPVTRRGFGQSLPCSAGQDCDTASVPMTRGTTPGPTSDEVRPDLLYTHGTLPGGGGSPIFDAETGDLIGIHLMSYPCAQNAPAGRRCAAAGTSLPRLLSALQLE